MSFWTNQLINHLAGKILTHSKKWGFFCPEGYLRGLIFLFLLISTFVYAETGTASYYTYESCRKEGTSGIYTASGEKFDENAYTCATWFYPFGTILKLTNLDNDLSVEVKVNDRGPAKRLVKKGRIIDLSKGAFSKLLSKGETLDKGLIKVKVEKL